MARREGGRAVHGYNSSGGTVTVDRSAQGVYQARFPGLAKGAGDTETVIVSPFGDVGRACAVWSWGNSGSDLVVNVRCFNRAGTAVDQQFFLMVIE